MLITILETTPQATNTTHSVRTRNGTAANKKSHPKVVNIQPPLQRNDKYYRQMFNCKKICEKLSSHKDYIVILKISQNIPRINSLETILTKLKENTYDSIYNFAWEISDLFNTLASKVEKDSSEFTIIKELHILFEKEFDILDKEIVEENHLLLKNQAASLSRSKSNNKKCK